MSEREEPSGARHRSLLAVRGKLSAKRYVAG
jgi:hypothetical protein